MRTYFHRNSNIIRETSLSVWLVFGRILNKATQYSSMFTPAMFCHVMLDGKNGEKIDDTLMS